MFNRNKMKVPEKKLYEFEEPYPYVSVYRTNRKLWVIFLQLNFCLVIKTDPRYADRGENDWDIGTLHSIEEAIFVQYSKFKPEGKKWK